eukprot:sb/3476126/
MWGRGGPDSIYQFTYACLVQLSLIEKIYLICHSTRLSPTICASNHVFLPQESVDIPCYCLLVSSLQACLIRSVKVFKRDRALRLLSSIERSGSSTFLDPGSTGITTRYGTLVEQNKPSNR